MTYKKWTEAECEWLRENYGKAPADLLCEKLGVTDLEVVKSKVKHLRSKGWEFPHYNPRVMRYVVPKRIAEATKLTYYQPKKCKKCLLNVGRCLYGWENVERSCEKGRFYTAEWPKRVNVLWE